MRMVTTLRLALNILRRIFSLIQGRVGVIHFNYQKRKKKLIRRIEKRERIG